MRLVNEIAHWWRTVSPIDLTWLAVGLGGQVLFSARWIIQWLASERVRRSIVPEIFWYLSLAGGLLVLAYGIYKREPVLILGQFGVLIYARNIYFLLSGRADKLPGEPAIRPPPAAE